MSEGFKKQKRKYLLGAIIKSAVCGLSFGLFAVGAVLLALKLAGIEFGVLYYVLIALCTALISGGVAFLFLKPGDKKIAADIDERYGLDEKVQTALAYGGAEGAVVQMLKSDTEEKLLNLPKTKLSFAGVLASFTKIWQYFLIALLSISIAVTGIVVPFAEAKPVEGGDNPGVSGGEDKKPFVFSNEQMDALQELINNVKKSQLPEKEKTSVVEYLNRLMNNLMFVDFEEEMIEFVTLAIQNVEKTLKAPLSYKAIANALGSLGQNDLAYIVATGAQTYKSVNKLETFTQTESLYTERVSAVTDSLKDALTNFYDALKAEEEEPEDEGDKPESGDGEEKSLKEAEDENGGTGGDEDDPSEGEESGMSVIEKACADFYTALTASKVADTDGLYVAIFGLAQALTQNEYILNNTIELNFEIEICKVLAEQTYFLGMNKYVTNTLRTIFGFNVPGDENFVPTYTDTGTGGENGDGDDPGRNPGQGGFGNGDMLYGSDDEVYHPALGYVKYGEIINEYYAMVEALLREGNLTEEQQAVLRAYFEILFSGLPAEEGE